MHLSESDVRIRDEAEAYLGHTRWSIQDFLDDDQVPADRVDHVIVLVIQHADQTVANALILWQIISIAAPHLGGKGVVASIACRRRERHQVWASNLLLHPGLDVLFVLAEGIAHPIDG